MAVTPTGAIYKALVFDGESSRDYGIYITGQAVYNAPERDVEMINIPGRNGSFALDKGRFQNIEVTYPAGIFADNEADFAQGISDFRNFLCSRNGYVRLTDDYNPDEYRMAVYKSGLDVSPAQLKAGEFSITFDCKPQRYLTSGEEAIDVTSGDTLLNPTLFESSPMLEVEGYGSININDDTVAIASDTIGWTIVAPMKTLDAASGSCTFPFNDSLANSGDDIRFNGGGRFANIKLEAKFNVPGIVTGTVPHTDPTGLEGGWSYLATDTETWLNLTASFPYASFDYGTQKTIGGTITFTPNFTDSTSKTIPLSVSLVYGGGNEFTLNWSTTLPSGATFISASVTSWQIELNSSKSALGFPLYIDLDIGEAYKIEDGAVVSINNAVTIPAELPKLKSGANEITFDNTVTDLKVVPRWWKI